MMNRPDKVELLDAVQDHLVNKLMPNLSGADAFYVRVATNALNVILRELQMPEQDNEQEMKRLNTLLKTEGSLLELNKALCKAIRSGELQGSDPVLRDHLWKTTMTKIAVDNPRYASYQKVLSDSAV